MSGGGVEEARREREISQRRLEEAIPLRDVLREMHRRNHLGDILDELVERKIERNN